MRALKLVVATLVLELVVGGANAASPATIGPALTTKIAIPNDSDDIAQIVGSGSSWLVVGNVEKNTIVN